MMRSRAKKMIHRQDAKSAKRAKKSQNTITFKMIQSHEFKIAKVRFYRPGIASRGV